MTKITKELLLEKGIPKHSKLEHIKKLNLSNLNLKTSDLDPVLFSQLLELEELDVSRNLLTEIPNNLGLANLKCLNCTNNDLEQITSLGQFENLEDLNCEDNLHLTICDTYKLIYLLPNLQQLNGSNITSSGYQLRFINSRQLKFRVNAYWDKKYKAQFLESSTADEMRAVGNKFVKSAVANVKYGPNSLSEFTKWRVEMIASELLASLLQHKEESSDSENEEENEDEVNHSDVFKNSGRSNVISGSSTELFSGRKTAEDIAKSAKNERTKVPQNGNEEISKTKFQSGKERQIKVVNPTKKDNKIAMNKEAKTTKRECSLTLVAVSKESTPKKKLKYRNSIVLEPLHYLQCHSKNNNPEDFSTQLWACAFEPEVESSQIPDVELQSSRNVAVCGGDSVCIIDCETGIVCHKYKSIGEEFFSLAWTTLTVIDKNQKRKLNVLAAAGRMGVVKLIHAKVNYCYGSVKAHKKPISTLCFSPKRETFLFTGSYDFTITLWDIGVPDLDYRFQASRLLVLNSCSTPLKMSLVPTCPDHYLVAACEKGCFAWDITPTKLEGKSIEMEFLFPIYNKEDNENDYHTIDTLAFCSDDLIASKSSKQGSIYLWSWSKTLKKWKKRNTKVHAEILREFEWSNTEESYIALTACPAENYLLCGDEKGDIWMYKLDEFSTGYVTSGEKTLPTQILKWPAIEAKGEIIEGTFVNVVITDSEFKYLVAATDKNIVVIWKRM
ncbi:leucine-rich repeat and WD repeat-containing protein 1 isoform X2 [Pristis pectinata]|uniref:leucine-rich repeat and WD repeat-containing protein 1 isoform X2 n=1 Tax=Pristis pectinata TaxID=685728 RepID=UPI00223D9C21|nr:leucine-rich repeat and WD repeat-containing protein 1 isoform X2 [Pristis pectinata]